MSGSLDQLIAGLTGILNSLTLLAGRRESGRTPNEAEQRAYQKYHSMAMSAMATLPRLAIPAGHRGIDYRVDLEERIGDAARVWLAGCGESQLDKIDAKLAVVRRRLDKEWVYLCARRDALAQQGGVKAGQRRRRKRQSLRAMPLTKLQSEAVHIVGECKGSFAEAGRRVGRDASTVRQHYYAAMRKMGKKVVKHATQPLPKDRRGQANISRDDDRRR